MLDRISLVFLLMLAVPFAARAATIELPQTGQAACYNAAGTVIPCAGTGQDGDEKTGVAWPAPRFTDHDNGTITDNLTGLIWLKNANCFLSFQPWAAALASASTLNNGQCGLSDNSIAGDWRLPNVNELESLIDAGRSNLTLPADHPFTGVQSGFYWTSTTHARYPTMAWTVGMDDANVGGDVKSAGKGVWPVRGGQ